MGVHTYHPRQCQSVQGGVSTLQGARQQVLGLEQLSPLTLVCGGTPAQNVYLRCSIEQSSAAPRPLPFPSLLALASPSQGSWTHRRQDSSAQAQN